MILLRPICVKRINSKMKTLKSIKNSYKKLRKFVTIKT